MRNLGGFGLHLRKESGQEPSKYASQVGKWPQLLYFWRKNSIMNSTWHAFFPSTLSDTQRAPKHVVEGNWGVHRGQCSSPNARSLILSFDGGELPSLIGSNAQRG